MKLSAVVYAALAAVTTVTAAPAPSPKRPIIKYPNSKYANQHHARAALAEADPLEVSDTCKIRSRHYTPDRPETRRRRKLMAGSFDWLSTDTL